MVVSRAASKCILQKLDSNHHQSSQLALAAFCTSPVTSLYVKAQEMSLDNRSTNKNLNVYDYELCFKLKAKNLS